jgi:ribulose-phosphate 3-epimerase
VRGDRIIPDFAKAGADIISFHPEASEHVDRTIALIRENGCKAGLVLNPATPLCYLDHVLDKLDLVLIMSVNPGFGGQTFIPGALDKLGAVRKRIAMTGKDIWLEVDGGLGDFWHQELQNHTQENAQATGCGVAGLRVIRRTRRVHATPDPR